MVRKTFFARRHLVAEREFAVRGAHLFDEGRVIGGRDDDRDVLIILGGGAQHGGSADIDVLDQFFQVRAGFGGHLFEAVKVDHHHVDGRDAVGADGRHVLRVAAHGEDAAGDFGVHRLHAAIQHFRESGDIADVRHGDSGVADQAGRAARGDQFRAHSGERGGEFDDACFVGDADEYAGDFCHLLAR